MNFYKQEDKSVIHMVDSKAVEVAVGEQLVTVMNLWQ